MITHSNISEFVALFDFVEDQMFWIKDRDGRYLRGNKALLVNFSLSSQDELHGKTDYELSPAYLADQFLQDDQRVLEGEKVVGRVELVAKFDFSADWFITNKLPLFDEDNKIWGTTGVTKKIESENETEFLSPQLRRSVNYIQENYATNITNSKLADISGFSVSAYERNFRKVFQCSPRQFIKRFRMSRACFELTNSNKPISKIATDHGFTDQSFFTKEFKSQLNRSPADYRKRFYVAKSATQI